MIYTYNFIQIKCLDCQAITNYEPGKYETIECINCKAKKEKTNAKKPRRNSKTTKKNTKSEE